jgi:hypothetical protein
MISDMVNLCLKEINKPQNKEKINDSIVEPLVCYILKRIKPFLIGSILFLFLTLSIMLCILFIVIFK